MHHAGPDETWCTCFPAPPQLCQKGGMNRRQIMMGLGLTALGIAPAKAQDYGAFLSALRARALARGIPANIADAALDGLTPNQKIMKLDQHQAEFTMTWAEYSARVVSAARIKEGRGHALSEANLLAAVRSRFGVGADALLGIWGIETNFGANQGDFQVIDALATLSYLRGSTYFGNEAIAAMRIAAIGDQTLNRLIGSYAGAMGQPQFMPSVYLSTAVSFTGKGRPDIWSNDADSLASIGNYLARAGWQSNLPSSEAVLAPPQFPASMASRSNMKPLAQWLQMGLRRLPGHASLPADTQCALLLPDGAGGEAFLVYHNFSVIRRYNPSDFYALAVGIIGRLCVA